eukprot:822698-Pleurochrysis_carterae.AAC.1
MREQSNGCLHCTVFIIGCESVTVALCRSSRVRQTKRGKRSLPARSALQSTVTSKKQRTTLIL